ncbi:hypothetical protein B0H34DRAFT_675286 [Crassisporium funariophilum]|nr:hypothetical protein B0H34DRAFT_675286 [Crassisporium funariophilum]
MHHTTVLKGTLPNPEVDNFAKQCDTFGTPPSRHKKVAYNVYYGQSTGVFLSWSSAECQVKFFSGCCYQSYASQKEAIEAWEYAVATKTVGPASSTFYSKQKLPEVPTLSHALDAASVMPANATAPLTTYPTYVLADVPAPSIWLPGHDHSAGSLMPSSPSSMSSLLPSFSVARPLAPSTPLSKGSATCLSTIKATLRYEPGIYADQKSAFAAKGRKKCSLCCMVETKEIANDMFVEVVIGW